MNQKRIGKFIKEKRIEKDLTQVVLAEKLGVSNRSVSKWENGVCLPDYSVLNDLCKILDISVDELLNGEEIENIKKDKKKNKKKVLITLIIFLIVFYILYKLFILVYFDNQFIYREEDKAFSNTNISSIEVKYNNKYKYDFNEEVHTLSYYIPSSYKLMTDKKDTPLVMDNCNLYMKGYVCKEKFDSFVSVCSNGYNNLYNLDYYGIDSQFFPSLNVHKILDKYNITNIIDLIKYYEKTKDYHNTIFTSSDRIKMNYIADRYANTVLSSSREFSYLEGDVLGYLQKFNEESYYGVVTFKRDIYNYDTYNINFYKMSYDEVMEIINSIQYN